MNNNIGVISIATNVYLDYYFSLLESFKEKCDKFDNITFYLFTDRIEDALFFVRNNQLSNVVVINIPNYSWPEATLLRFQVISENRFSFSEECLVYIDADMQVEKDPIPFFEESKNSMSLIRHPGYYYNFSFKYLFFSIRNLRRTLSHFKLLITRGRIGAWDECKSGLAFVPFFKARHYFCGGIWFGNKEIFLNMCQILAERTSKGLMDNFMPIWHDESYVNWYASTSEICELTPILCADGKIDSLYNGGIYIRAVDKPVLGFHGN